MIAWVGDNIISSLGFTTEENYRAVESLRSGLALRESGKRLQEPYMASLIDKERLTESFNAISPDSNKYTPLEQAAILSVCDAVSNVDINLAGSRVLFLLSSTKGNVYLLDTDEKTFSREHLYLGYSAQLIADFFKNPNTPLVISNACISGACAQIAAMRELESGLYDYAVVTGVDFLSDFIVSGFQSFKALSQEVCRPFDNARNGLNLGEAASTIIYKRVDDTNAVSGIVLRNGAVRNDANHISGPSRTGEGCFLAVQAASQGVKPDEIAFVNAHGTATPYNDQMEAVALTRAGLNNVPVNSLKGCFGHTLGAAGVLESVVSAHALAEGTVIPSYGFSVGSEEYPLNVITQPTSTRNNHYLKLLSGFGGCNAALLFQKI